MTVTVNQRPTAVGALPDLTLTLGDAPRPVDLLGAFSDPDGDPLSYAATSLRPAVATANVTGSMVMVTAVAAGTAAIVVTATDPGGLDATQSFLVTVAANQRPIAVGILPDRTLKPGAAPEPVDLSGAFSDPDGDPLSYAAMSSAPAVVTATTLTGAAVVTLTAAGEGTATVVVTATDPGGLDATQSFAVTVRVPAPFTDDPIRPGVTPVRDIHFQELRTRIDALRARWRLPRFPWTDPVLRAGVTPVRLAHLLELRSALGEAYAAAGRPAPPWTDGSPVAGRIPIRAVHLTELRDAVLALE